MNLTKRELIEYIEQDPRVDDYTPIKLAVYVDDEVQYKNIAGIGLETAPGRKGDDRKLVIHTGTVESIAAEDLKDLKDDLAFELKELLNKVRKD